MLRSLYTILHTFVTVMHNSCERWRVKVHGCCRICRLISSLTRNRVLNFCHLTFHNNLWVAQQSPVQKELKVWTPYILHAISAVHNANLPGDLPMKWKWKWKCHQKQCASNSRMSPCTNYFACQTHQDGVQVVDDEIRIFFVSAVWNICYIRLFQKFLLFLTSSFCPLGRARSG